jgi:uncharacterized protein (UPF0147 family)
VTASVRDVIQSAAYATLRQLVDDETAKQAARAIANNAAQALQEDNDE